MIETVINDDGLIAEAQRRADKQSGNDKPAAEKGKIEKRLNALTVILRKLYEDYAAELLDGDNYKAMLADYQSEQRALKERLTTVENELNKTDDFDGNFKKLKQIAAAYADCKELTAETVKRLIERIEIGHIQKIDGKPTQRISIAYRFIKTNI